jgi:uncharacterized protein YkwD
VNDPSLKSGSEGEVVRIGVVGAVCVVLAASSAAQGARVRSASAGDLAPGVLAEINAVREHPGDYAERLRDGPMTPATREAIAYLERRDPAQPLRFEPGLGASAARHAADLGEHGAFEHTGSDGSSAGERMHRQGVYAGLLAEEMSAGEGEAADVVRQLIVDEDVPGRAHRNDLLDPFLRLAGVGCAPHPTYGVICVIDLASAPPPRD